jgi:hypothetical protein
MNLVASSPLIDFADELSAAMVGVSPENYIQIHEDLLENLGAIEEKAKAVKVQTLDDYFQVAKLASVIEGLWIYTSNKKKPEEPRVLAATNVLQRKLFSFAKNYQIASGEVLGLIRYMCWASYYFNHDAEKIARMVLVAGHLFSARSETRTSYFVTGMHLKTGDNTFTVSSNGRQSRNYQDTFSLQAFYVSNAWNQLLCEMEGQKTIVVPTLLDYYKHVDFGNFKYAARTIGLTYEESRIVQKSYWRS